MVKLGLVRLNLREIPVIEVARVPQLVVLEYDDSAALITDRKILARLVVADGRQQIILGDILLVALTQAIDVDPITTVGDTIWVDLRLSLRLILQIVGRHDNGAPLLS